MKRLSIFFAALMACTLSFAQTDYSKTYTSNVTIAAGDNASEAKVVIGGTEYDAMKAGTSKNAGSVKITVPANMTNLHIHAIVWKGQTGKITIKGATCTPATLTLAANDGISNTTPFTISGDMSEDYYFNVALKDVKAETTLTLSCPKRFVIFGVNAVAAQAVEATAIALDKQTLELEQYRTEELNATLTPADATTIVEWTSSDENVATVGSNGVVSAVGVGTATITATAGSVSATCDVTVVTATVLKCAEVVELAKDLNSGDILAGGKRVVRGYVTEYYKVPADDMEEYGNYSVYMADTKDGGKIFEAFQVKPVDGKTVVAIGDYVEVIGEITKYNTTIETVGKGAATIKKIENTGTALDNNTVDGVVVEKVIRDGQVLIIRDGKIYNAQGAKL